jgi:hypothetical protein
MMSTIEITTTAINQAESTVGALEALLDDYLAQRRALISQYLAGATEQQQLIALSGVDHYLVSELLAFSNHESVQQAVLDLDTECLSAYAVIQKNPATADIERRAADRFHDDEHDKYDRCMARDFLAFLSGGVAP